MEITDASDFVFKDEACAKVFVIDLIERSLDRGELALVRDRPVFYAQGSLAVQVLDHVGFSILR